MNMRQLIEKTNRFVFTCDVLRICEPRLSLFNSQGVNLDTIINIFGHSVKKFGKEVVSISGNENNKELRRSFYVTNKIEPTVDNWAKIFTGEGFSDTVDSLLNKYFYPEDFVFGFELPPYLKAFFNRKNILFLDIKIHPVRYLRDYMFCFYSNYQPLNKKLETYAIDELEFYHAANLLAAQFRRNMSEDIIKMERGNNIVFFGQLLGDAQLISKKGPVQLGDIIEVLNLLASQYETCYFKPHPFFKTPFLMNKLKNCCPDVVIIDHNAYQLLSSCIENFAAMSSGTIYEAKYFNKHASWYLNGFVEDRYYGEYYIPILDSTFERNFIKSIFGVEELGTDYRQLKSYSYTPLKDILGIKWGR